MEPEQPHIPTTERASPGPDDLRLLLRTVRAMAWNLGRFWGTHDELFSVGETEIARRLSSYDPAKGDFQMWGVCTAKFAMNSFLRGMDPQGKRWRARLDAGQKPGRFRSKNGRLLYFEHRRLVSDSCLQFIGVHDRRDDGPELHPLIARLKPKQQFAVRHRFFEERELTEIASMMGLSKSRACQLVREGLTELRKLYLRAI